MNWRRGIIILLAGCVLLILLHFECKNGIAYSKIKLECPYRMTILKKEKYNLKDDMVVYNELASIPKKFFSDEYCCEEIRRHLYNKFQSFVDSIFSKSKGAFRLNSPINTIFNSGMTMRRAMDIYGNGTNEHIYFIRGNREDFNEVFIHNNYVYIA